MGIWYKCSEWYFNNTVEYHQILPNTIIWELAFIRSALVFLNRYCIVNHLLVYKCKLQAPVSWFTPVNFRTNSLGNIFFLLRIRGIYQYLLSIGFLKLCIFFLNSNFYFLFLPSCPRQIVCIRLGELIVSPTLIQTRDHLPNSPYCSTHGWP